LIDTQVYERDLNALYLHAVNTQFMALQLPGSNRQFLRVDKELLLVSNLIATIVLTLTKRHESRGEVGFKKSFTNQRNIQIGSHR
jgi:hypothetical protein